MSHNTPNYREKESKFLVHDSWKSTLKTLRTIYPNPEQEILATTLDDYWKLQNSDSFLRLRSSWGHTGTGKRRTLREVTVKTKDKGNNLDRLEINAGIKGVKDMRALLKVALGRKLGRIRKVEAVWFTKNSMVISLTRIKGRLYLEVESPSKWRNLSEKLKLLRKIKMTSEPRSLFEIYIRS